MITITENDTQTAEGYAIALRSLAWSGLPILDACTVQAGYGHLLLLTSDGTLHGIDCDTGASVSLCHVDLPDMVLGDDDQHFGAPTYRLHASADGEHAAIVVDKGRHGIVVEVPSGKVTMRLNGGDYYEETVPFSACFLRFEGRNVFIHRTKWNRLDAADPATGESLTERYIAPHEESGNPPEHHLDYFHGQLRPSPGGQRIFDDGWVWHPCSIPRAWSVTDWLASNPWESEDGPSIVDLTARDHWNTAACWVNDRHIALWNMAGYDEDSAEPGLGKGMRIFDVTERKQSSDPLWTMDKDERAVLDLFSDGKRLYVVTDTGTTVWDVASREKIAGLPKFTARLHDPHRCTLVAIGAATIVELSLPSLVVE